MLKLFIRKKKASLEHAEEELKKTLDNNKVDALERMVGLLEKIDANTNNPLPTTVNVSSAAVKKIAKQTSEELSFIPSINTIDTAKTITKKKTTKKRNISETAKKLKKTK